MTGPKAEAVAQAYVRDVIMHEVGHTLGLRHNFRSSTIYTFKQLQDRQFTQAHGLAGSVMDYLPFNLALLKGASIVGVFWGDFAKREPKANTAMMMELAQWYGQGKIKPVIDCTMPMADLKAAFAHMGSRGVKGKLVMVN